MQVQFIYGKCLAQCNHHGLALNLSACTVARYFRMITALMSNFSKSSQAGNETLKRALLWLLFIYSLITIFSTWVVYILWFNICDLR